MRPRHLLSAFAALVVLLVALPLASSFGASRASRAASLRDSIEARRGEIARNRSRDRVLSSDVSAIDHRIGGLQADITRLQRRQIGLQVDLDARRVELGRTQASLNAERARLARLRKRLAETRRVLATRLRQVYEAGQPDTLSVVLRSKGFADLLERGEFLGRINARDGRVIAAVRVARTEAVRTERRLAGLEARQRAVAVRILARRNQVASVRGQLVAQRRNFTRARATRARMLVRIRGQSENLEGNLTRLEAAESRVQSAIRAAQNANTARFAPAGGAPAGPVRRGSGSLIWPVNGPITSQFCERRAWEACHPGVDIGVPAGTPIRAAGSGRVVLQQSAGASGGYGNYTCIQHTSTMSSCYAHQSRFATSSGASVRQGQVIGYVGCTGRCFGDHLHFEVRLNGAVTNPMNYL